MAGHDFVDFSISAEQFYTELHKPLKLPPFRVIGSDYALWTGDVIFSK